MESNCDPTGLTRSLSSNLIGPHEALCLLAGRRAEGGEEDEEEEEEGGRGEGYESSLVRGSKGGKRKEEKGSEN